MLNSVRIIEQILCKAIVVMHTTSLLLMWPVLTNSLPQLRPTNCGILIRRKFNPRRSEVEAPVDKFHWLLLSLDEFCLCQAPHILQTDVLLLPRQHIHGHQIEYVLGYKLVCAMAVRFLV